MANVEGLYAMVGAVIVNFPRWNQASWVGGIVNPVAANHQQCRTTACGAGFVCLIYGLRPDYELVEFFAADGTMARVAKATGRFIDPATGRSVNAGVHAQETLDLAEHEAEYLFHYLGSDINEFVRRVRVVAEGRLNEYGREIPAKNGADDSAPVFDFSNIS